MGSSSNQGLGWVRVLARGFKSQSEVHSFKRARYITLLEKEPHGRLKPSHLFFGSYR